MEFLRWIAASHTQVSFKKNSPYDSRSRSHRLRTRNHASAKQKKVPVSDNLRADAFKAFSAMDSDANGQLSEAEFTRALTQVLGNVSKSEINRLYHIVDSDRSGSITFDEFLYAVAHSSEISRVATTLKTEYHQNKFEWEIPFEELEFGPKIGEGTYGVVYKGKWHGTPVAIKTLKFPKLTNAILEDFRKEVAILAKLRHPNVVLFMGASTHQPNLCIVTEFLDGGSVYSLLHQRKSSKKLSAAASLRIAIQTARGLNYLHQVGLIHRDLKSMNLLLDENYTCKLCDFGLSCVKPKQNEPLLKEQVGSPLWMAPEVLSNNAYTEKVDVYSFAICVWEFLTYQLPFEDLDFDQLVKVVTQGKRPIIPATCPAALANLVKECWDKNPDKRPSFTSILHELEQIVKSI